jgi:hypothetical protein
MPVPFSRALAAAAAALILNSASAAVAAPTGDKLDSALRGLVSAHNQGASVPARAERSGLAVSAGERIAVDVSLRGGLADAQDKLRALGMTVKAATSQAPLPVIEGLLPVDQLDAAAALAGVRAIRSIHGVGADTGAVLSQGDAAHRGPQARAFGATGAGVKVGVISDSINQKPGTAGQTGSGVAASKSSGELPASVDVLKDRTGASDEGRAMAEIIYDEAPGITQMAFASGTGNGATSLGAPNKADSINQLVASGAKIIADDIFMLDEPFFQDGVVAQAVDAAKAAGVAYFASAGNRARQSYEANTAFGANPAPHDFDPSGAVDTIQTIGTVATAANGGFAEVGLQWDEPIGAVDTDLDIEIVRLSDNAVLASSADDNRTSGFPIEDVFWQNLSGSTVPVGIRITRFAGSRNPFIKDIVFGSFAGGTAIEYPTNSDAINPDATSALGAMSVAAIRYNEPGLNDPESFSSRGPKTRLFDKDGNRLATPDVREKPNLAAADGVLTSVTGFDSLSFSHGFFGTSAATPSAAGIAALALSAKPALGVDGLRAIMTDPANTNDCPLAGLPDFDCGWGFVFADRVVGMALDSTPPAITSTLTGVARNAAGWARGATGVTFAVSDTQSPVSAKSNCDPVTLTSDGTRDVSCTATSAGGSATSPTVTLRRDTAAPAAPTFAGITAATFTTATVPAQAAITCTASDATSGLASCAVSGYSAALGPHTLTALATDVAGNTASSALAYTVIAAPIPHKLVASDVVSFPSTLVCRKRPAKLSFALHSTVFGKVTKVRITATGRKAVTKTKLPATIKFTKLRQAKITINVTVTFAGGSVATQKKTYKTKRRC